ncbi:MAG: hydrogenase, partial [Bdellovibrionia bacterium]
IATLEDFQTDFETMNQLFRSSATVSHRLSKTGIITKKTALDLGLVGLSARASGVAIDTRCDLLVSPYTVNPVQPVSEQAGDCLARSLVRIREIEESTKWILSVLRSSRGFQLPNVTLQSPGPGLSAMSVIEGWRGEVFHYLETGSDGKISHYRIQDPSLRNWFAVAQSVRGEPISDFPICNKSFDLSYCGNDL